MTDEIDDITLFKTKLIYLLKSQKKQTTKLCLQNFETFNAPVICNPGPLGAGDTGDLAGLKCRDLTSEVARQCRGCAGVLISR